MAISGHGLEESQKDTFIYDLRTDLDGWTPSHQLNIGRYFHACEKFKLDQSTIIVVAGGIGWDFGRFEKVEFLDLQLDSGWVLGKSLPIAVAAHVLAPSANGQGVLSIGGMTEHNGMTGDIHELQCNGSLDDCQWVTLKQKLEYPRELFGAMLIPDSLANELCN